MTVDRRRGSTETTVLGGASQTLRGSSTCERGQAVVEFALIVPFVVVLALALIQCGRLLYAYIGMNGLAQATARYATVNAFPFGANPGEFACNRVGANGKGLTIAWSSSPTPPAAGDTITVTVSNNYNIVTRVPIHVAVSAAMRLEQAPTFSSAGSKTC